LWLVGWLDKTLPQQQQTAAERQFLICGKVIAESDVNIGKGKVLS
jgi:hypothetical protein